MPGLSWLAQQLLPPALLCYFTWAWRRCTFDVGQRYLAGALGYRHLGTLYSALPTVLVPPIAACFLRLYFLPAGQSVPPRLPPADILRRRVIFEAPAPALLDGRIRPQHIPSATVAAHDGRADAADADDDDDAAAFARLVDAGLAERCFRGTCRGRWKPARARHCSECRTCRCAFDHHCAFFANCLTAPNLPPFLLLLLLTPPTTLLLSLPLYASLLSRARAAYAVAADPADPAAAWWWAARWTWAFPAGPVGRQLGGLALGWRALDRVDGGGPAGAARLEFGALVALGMVLGLITAVRARLAAPATALALVRTGSLTVDRARAKTWARSARSSGDAAGLLTASRFSPVRWFYVPLALVTSKDGEHANGERRDGEHENGERGDSARGESSEVDGDGGSEQADAGGVLVPTLPDEQPYDLGPRANWALMLPAKWWLPTARGVDMATALNWPVAPAVRARLVDVARDFAEGRRRAHG